MKQIFIKIKHDHYISLDVNDIMYIKVNGDYCTIHLNDIQYTIESTMKSIENKLKEYNFFRIHNNTIVNISHIKSIEDSCVYLKKEGVYLNITRDALSLLKLKLIIL